MTNENEIQIKIARFQLRKAKTVEQFATARLLLQEVLDGKIVFIFEKVNGKEWAFKDGVKLCEVKF